MLPPLPRCSGWASSSLVSPNRVSLPRFHVRVGLHIVLFEVCSAFTRVAACTLARSPYVVTAIRRLQTLRLLHACSGCFRLERIAGWGLHPLESAALSRRTWKAVVRFLLLVCPRCAIQRTWTGRPQSPFHPRGRYMSVQTLRDLDARDRQLVQDAKRASTYAYAPYSGFAVGA